MAVGDDNDENDDDDDDDDDDGRAGGDDQCGIGLSQRLESVSESRPKLSSLVPLQMCVKNLRMWCVCRLVRFYSPPNPI